MLNFKPSFFTLLFYPHQEALSPSSFSTIRVVSSAYLRLLMFLLPILISACNSSILAFLMTVSAYRLNQQGDSRQPCRTPFSILNQSVVPYRVLTVASWSAYRFLRRQVRWSGIPISLRAFHSLLWPTHRLSHSRWNRGRCFSWNPPAFSIIQWMLAISSLVPLLFLNPAWTSGSSWIA